MKYWVKQNDGSTAVMQFYGSISRGWNDGKEFANILMEIQNKYTSLEIKLHCYGGEVFEGNVMFNALLQSKLNITWFIDGVAASMGGILPLAKGRVVMAENAFWMIHIPSTMTSGGANDHFAAAKVLKSIEANFAKAYARKTGKPEADVKAWFDGSDHWFDAAECLQLKLADEITTPVDTTGAIEKPTNGVDIQNIYNRYTALTNANNFPNNKTEQMNKKEVIAKFNLTGVDENSSETAIYDAIEAKNNAAINAATVGAFKAQAKAMIAAKEAAMNVKFTTDQIASFEALAVNEAGIKSLETVLAAMQPVPNINNLLEKEGKATGGSPIAADRAGWTWDKWEKEDPAGLEALEASNIEAFTKLYNSKFPKNEAKFS